MDKVVQLEDVRAARDARRLADTAMHPCTRWILYADRYAAAHRRHPDGLTVCGLGGRYILAPSGVRQCPDCYPPLPAG